VRYEFQPIANTGTSNGIFYVYDSHYKSGGASTSADGSTDGALRNGEAQIIRNDEAANLPANAAVLYVGDYNLDGSTEAMYQTLTAVKSPSGVSQGQAFDPMNPTDNYNETWEFNATYQGIMTESDKNLEYRDDLETMTGNVYNDATGNLDYISGSYHAFGNNGTTPEDGNTDSPSTNTSLNDIVGNGPLTPTAVLGAMNKSLGSDHLPVVSDYSLALASQNLTWDNAGTNLINDGMTWDVNNFLNWNSGSNASTYTEGSNITFNDVNNGHYNVTLNATVTPGSVTVNNSSGNYFISGTGSITGAGSLTKSGTGTLVLSTVNTFTGGTNVSGGVLQINPTSATTSALPAGPVSLSGNGVLQLTSNVTLGSQSANTPVTSPTSNVMITSLSIAGNGTLDITNNHILINYGSGSDPIASIAAWIAGGAYGVGTTVTWTGTGITSSAAAVNSGSYGIGYADAADAGNPAGLASGQIEVMYTLLGDANLDGKVNGADFNLMATNFNQSVTAGWDEGDFNYDGKVNGNDFVLLAANFNQFASQSAVSAADEAAVDAFAAANGISLASVPEPASIGMLVVAGVGMLARRKRKMQPPRHGERRGIRREE
jgi:autotransporter-associated beta strand protein